MFRDVERCSKSLSFRFEHDCYRLLFELTIRIEDIPKLPNMKKAFAHHHVAESFNPARPRVPSLSRALKTV